nr:CpsD/CapB family tyrosine-protein kinase [Verrucomicrobiota bacterium]
HAVTNGAPPPAGAAAGQALIPWERNQSLHAYYEGLRDRLVTHFEIHDMNHKPKLVAVTGCAPGAGVTTVAAGLAAALSETGDGNVLLVDMNQEQAAVQQFYHGKPARGLSEALEADKRDDACVAENFYLVTAKESVNQNLPRVLPKRIASLVPKMKASDFDYIIFDMPPVMQTSITPRLSTFMDMVLMVVESEKTGREVVQRAQNLLRESRANVATVLNKHRAYVPKRLSQEL